ncbi:MAG: hypothetical protein JWM11_6418 [Planctomycetaceae bacterium]|nr:hypothetical protein [Planctomycetaceae bacterium]
MGLMRLICPISPIRPFSPIYLPSVLNPQFWTIWTISEVIVRNCAVVGAGITALTCDSGLSMRHYMQHRTALTEFPDIDDFQPIDKFGVGHQRLVFVLTVTAAV